MEETVRDVKHPLVLREFTPSLAFYREFDNCRRSFKTLLCFSLHQPKKTLYDLWGYTFNEPSHKHAELVALRAIAEFLVERGRLPTKKYQLTFYSSFSPCKSCCRELVSFLKLHEAVEMHIMVAKLYYPEDLDTQKHLRLLQRAGVTLRVMTSSDFKQCHHLFVDPRSKFNVWSKVDVMSEHYSALLKAIFEQCEEDSESEYSALGGSVGEKSPCQSLKGVDTCAAQGTDAPETPQKASQAARSMEDAHGKAVKRRLYTDD